MTKRSKKQKELVKEINPTDWLKYNPRNISVIVGKMSSGSNKIPITYHITKNENLISELKKIIPDGVQKFLFQPKLNNGKVPDLALISKKGNQYYLEFKNTTAQGEIALYRLLKDNFGGVEAGIDEIKKNLASNTYSQVMNAVRESTEPLTRVLKRAQQTISVTNFKTGAVRKQRYRPNKLDEIAYLKSVLHLKPKTLSELKQKGFAKADLSKARGANFIKYLSENKIEDVFGVVKFYKNNKDKKYKPQNWEDLNDVLRSLNFTLEEVLTYCINSIQTKERFLRHRLYREIENNNLYALNTFIDIYKKNLKNKVPLKSFSISPELIQWQKHNDIYFKSDENLRTNSKLMIEAWNKLHPKDKLPLKLK